MGYFTAWLLCLSAPVNEFYLVLYLNLKVTKLGGQRWSGTHPKPPRELKAETGQKPGILATSQPARAWSRMPALLWANCLQPAPSLTQTSAYGAAKGKDVQTVKSLSPEPKTTGETKVSTAPKQEIYQPKWLWCLSFPCYLHSIL